MDLVRCFNSGKAVTASGYEFGDIVREAIDGSPTDDPQDMLRMQAERMRNSQPDVSESMLGGLSFSRKRHVQIE